MVVLEHSYGSLHSTHLQSPGYEDLSNNPYIRLRFDEVQLYWTIGSLTAETTPCETLLEQDCAWWRWWVFRKEFQVVDVAAVP